MGAKPTRRQFLQSLSIAAGGMIAAQAPFRLLASPNEQESERPLLLAHYMPWYQAPSISGYWGWHWTMDHFDPTQTDENGRPQIASHYMPLTGPYDSSDPAILEYQVALMKLSGIDGVIVDWYGIEDFRDYAACNRSTNLLFDAIKAAGLKFCICYEDQSLKHMETEGLITREEALLRGQDVMRYMHERWFSDDTYLKYGDQPVLLTFGPQYFKGSADWAALFSVIDPQPALVTLDKHMVLDALSSFPWPPMSGFTVNQAVLEAYTEQFYRKAQRWDYIVGGAFPAFHDSYQDAGVRASYGYIDAQDGETLRYTLQASLDANADIVQLITWNDYGEGTIIEPTDEFGYKYLEIIQATAQSLQGDSFTFIPDNLPIPLRLYNLRSENPDDAALNARIDEAYAAINAGDAEGANAILAAL